MGFTKNDGGSKVKHSSPLGSLRLEARAMMLHLSYDLVYVQTTIPTSVLWPLLRNNAIRPKRLSVHQRKIEGQEHIQHAHERQYESGF